MTGPGQGELAAASDWVGAALDPPVELLDVLDPSLLPAESAADVDTLGDGDGVVDPTAAGAVEELVGDALGVGAAVLVAVAVALGESSGEASKPLLLNS